MMFFDSHIAPSASFTHIRRHKMPISLSVPGCLLCLGTIRMALPPLARNALTKRHTMWLARALTVVFAYAIDLLEPSLTNVLPRTVLTLAEMSICHHPVAIELLNRQVTKTLETSLHTNIDAPATSPDNGRTNGNSQANGMSSSGISFVGTCESS